MHLFVHAISHYQAMKYRSCQIELSPEPFIVEIYLLSTVHFRLVVMIHCNRRVLLNHQLFLCTTSLKAEHAPFQIQNSKMPKAYSIDLRWRAVWLSILRGMRGWSKTVFFATLQPRPYAFRGGLFKGEIYFEGER